MGNACVMVCKSLIYKGIGDSPFGRWTISVGFTHPTICYPKLCLAVCPHDMNMDRLSRIALVRVEEKAKAIMAEYGWHRDRLSGILGCGNGGMVREITHPTDR